MAAGLECGAMKSSSAAETPAASALASYPAYWRWQLAGWGAWVLLHLELMLSFAFPMLPRALEYCALAALGLALTHLLRQFIRWRRWRELSVLSLLPRAALACLVLALLPTFAEGFLSVSSLVLSSSPMSNSPFSLRAYAAWIVVFALWLDLYFTIRPRRALAGELALLQAPAGSMRAYWTYQLAGWGAYVTLFAPQALTYSAGPWWRVVSAQIVLAGCGLLLSHLLRGFIHRQRWTDLDARQLIPRVVIAAILVGAPFEVARWLLRLFAATPHTVGTLSGLGPGGIFLVWMVLYFNVVSQRRRQWLLLRQSEMARALHQAELRALKSQINPHFLFNSINSVRALVADEPERAQSALTQLARTLRYSLAAGQDERVTLKEELAIVEDYLALEALRLDDNLRVERDIAPAALAAQIPVMLLQTVVENAIKHGIAELDDGGVLQLSAAVEQGALLITVRNPRPPGPAAAPGEGIGLKNSAERLRLLFGAEARLDLDLSQPERAVTRIRIPLPA